VTCTKLLMNMSKKIKYKIDEWVYFCEFPDFKYLSDERKRSVILQVLLMDPIYDYEIFVDGEGKIKKVKESQLFPIITPTY